MILGTAKKEDESYANANCTHRCMCGSNVAVFQPKRTGNAFLGCIVYFYLSSLCTNKLAALIFFIACCCLLFGKVTFREAAAMFAGGFCVFALPYAAERILERISDLNRCVKDWVRG